MSLTDILKDAFREVSTNANQFLKNKYHAAALGATLALAPTIGANAQPPITQQPVQEQVTTTSTDVNKLLNIDNDYQQGNFDNINNVLRQELYSNSGHLYKLNEARHLELIGGVPFSSIDMVGFNYHSDKRVTGMFLDERERNWSTTYSSMCNQAGCTEDELKTIINLSNNIPKEDMRVIYDMNNKFVSVVYTGTQRRDDVRNRVLINGNVINNHINWERGATAKIPTDLALKLTGYDLDIARQIRRDQEFGKEIQNQIYDALEDKTKQVEEKEAELEGTKGLLDESKAVADSLKAKADTTEVQRKTLAEVLRKAEAGAGLFVSTEGNLAYALSIGRGVGKNNRTLALLGLYHTGKLTETQGPVDVTTSSQFLPVFNWNAVSIDSISSATSNSWQGATLGLSYEVMPNFSVLGGVHYRRTHTTQTTNQVNHTYFHGIDNVRFGEENWRETNAVINNVTEFAPVIGAKYNLGRVSLFGLYNPSHREINFGATFNILQNKSTNGAINGNGNGNGNGNAVTPNGNGNGNGTPTNGANGANGRR